MISLVTMLAVTVTVSGLGSDGTANRNLIQAELNKARTLNEHLKVCIPAGTYPLSTTLFIYSNTELSLSPSTTFTRKGSASHNMLYARHLRTDGEVCNGDASCNHGGYSQFSNISVSGGVWDAGNGAIEDGGIFHLCHGSDIIIRDATFQHASGHMLNLSGSRNILVENCTFRDAERYEGTDPGFWGDYEVGDEEAYKTVESIHLDVVSEEGEAGNYPTDNTPCANVTVRGCSFTDVFSAAGSHHYYPGIWLDGFTVQNCAFTRLLGPAVHSMGVTNCVLSGCQASELSGIIYAAYSSGRVAGNTVMNSTQDGILLYENTDYEVIDNVVSGSAREGVNVYKSKARIGGNAITNSGNCAVLASSQSQVEIANCSLYGAKMHGVCALGGSEVDASGTTIGGFLEDGIAVSDAVRVGIRDCVIQDGKIGIYLTSVAHGEVCNNELRGMSSFGIAASGGDVRFKDNRIRETNGFGMRMDNCNSAKIEQSILENIKATAIYVVGGSVNVLNNRIVSPAEHGIVAADAATMTVEGNSVLSPTKSGMYLVSRSSGEVNDNEVSNAGEDGIFLYEGVDCALIGNRVVGSARNGINLYKSKARISANVISNCISSVVNVSSQSQVEIANSSLYGAKMHGVCALGGSEVDVSGTTIGGFLEDGIAVSDAARVGIRDCVIQDGKIGIYLTSVAHGEVCNNELRGMSSFGIAASGGDVRFKDNRIRETNGFGMRMDNCNGAKIEQSILENIKATAIYVVGGAVDVSGCRIVSPAEHGILSTGGAALTVRGVDISSPVKTGIYLVGGHDSVVVENRITNVGAKAIWLQDSTNVKVSANEISGAAEEGVYCMRSSSLISYNSVLGAGKIAIRVDGTEVSKASAKILKNIAESSMSDTWHDIRFVGYCVNSSAKGNVVMGKGLWVEPTSADEVEIADDCSQEEAALLDYYDISFNADGGVQIPRIVCKRGAVYRLPKSGGKGWRGSNHRFYDDEILVFDLVPNGQTLLMTVAK